MRLTKRLVIALALTLWSARPSLVAQDHHHGELSKAQRLGKVSFPVSCSPSVQASFERGIALLHSFGYNEARSQFREIEDRHPNCAMAYWGEAMTMFHQLWDRPSQDDLKRGFALVEKAQQIGGTTEREREYIGAAAVFYTSDHKATYETRTEAYSRALEHLCEQFPNDDEAKVFYALSLLASPDANKNNLAYRKKAVSLLKEVFSRRPDHPGVAHYLIHACDNPAMAKQALPAAKSYAQIAPASAHAVHMPSHIFARLGLWQDDVRSNLASKAIAEQQHAAADRLHAMDFLEYACLQLGDLDRAKAIETEALSVKKQDFSKDMQDYFFYVQVHFPSLNLLETKNWNAAYSLTVPADYAPDFQAGIYWAKAIAAAHLHDIGATKDAVNNYDLALDAVRKTSYAYVAEQMTSSRDEAHAFLAFVQGNVEEATRLLSSVADKQDREGKGEVEIPAREMLADMLLALNHPEDALAQYELSLKADPNRFNSLCGAAHAAELAHEPEKAEAYYEDLLAGRENGPSSHHPELVHARAYLQKGRS